METTKDPKLKDQYSKKIALLSKEIVSIQQKDIKRVDIIKNPDKKRLIEIEQDNYELRQLAEQIEQDPDLNEDQRKEELAEELDREVNVISEDSDGVNTYLDEYRQETEAEIEGYKNRLKNLDPKSKEYKILKQS